MGFTISRLSPCNSTCCCTCVPHMPHLICLKHGAHLPWEFGLFTPSAGITYGTGAGEVQGCFLSLQGLTTNKAMVTAWESPSFGYFNNIVQVHLSEQMCCLCKSWRKSHRKTPNQTNSKCQHLPGTSEKSPGSFSPSFCTSILILSLFHTTYFSFVCIHSYSTSFSCLPVSIPSQKFTDI